MNLSSPTLSLAAAVRRGGCPAGARRSATAALSAIRTSGAADFCTLRLGGCAASTAPLRIMRPPAARSQRSMACMAAAGGDAPSESTIVVDPTPAAPAAEPKVKGKTVIVTGGSQGSGKEVALSFAAKGYNVVVAARQPERLETVAEEIRAMAPGKEGAGLAIPCDIASPSDVKALFSEVAATYEQVDCLVNVAGVCCAGDFMSTPDEEWTRMLDVNLMGAVNMTRAFVPMLRETKGSIVNVNSFGGVLPLTGMTAYCASKFALDGFSKSLGYELAKEGIHVGQVHPGVIDSDFLERAQYYGEKAGEARASTESAMKAPGVGQSPKEIADAVDECVKCRKTEIIVGAVFQGLVTAYRVTGKNVASLGA